MSLIICSECGKEYSDNAAACPNCGNPTKPTSNYTPSQSSAEPQMSGIAVSQYVEKLAAKEQASSIIWGAIAGLQIIVGFSGYFTALFIGILNAVAAYQTYQKSKKIRTPYVGMVEEYENKFKSLLINLIVNGLLGAIIGIAGSIFDLFTRNYVLSNRAIFEKIIAENARKREEEAKASGKVCLTLYYSNSLAGASICKYTIDGQPEEYSITNTCPELHYLTPGNHTIEFKYNMKKVSFQIDLNQKETVNFYGNMKTITLQETPKI